MKTDGEILMVTGQLFCLAKNGNNMSFCWLFWGQGVEICAKCKNEVKKVQFENP